MRPWHTFGRIALTVALTTLAFSAAAQTQPALGNLRAAEAEISGPMTFVGSLISLQRFDPASDDAITPESDFLLTAPRLRIETHNSNPHATGAVELVLDEKTSNQTYADAVVEGTQFHPGYIFHVIAIQSALPLITVATNCSAFIPSQHDIIENEKILQPSAEASSAHPLTQDVSNTVQWTECGQGLVRIEGSFVLALWQVQAELEANGERRDLPSGYAPTEGAPALYPTVSHARQQFLFAEDAVLTIPAMDASSHLAFVQDAALDVDGEITFREATGTLGRGGAEQSVQAHFLTVDGQIRFAASFQSKQYLHNVLSGHLDEAVADGQPLSFTATPSPGGLSRWSILMLVGGVLASPMLFMPRVVRRRREAMLAAGEVDEAVERVEQLVARHRYVEALPASRELVGMLPYHPRAHFLRATVLRRMGYSKEVLEHHERTCDLGLPATFKPGWAAALDLEAARAAMDLAQSGRGNRPVWEAKALQHLRQAMAVDGAVMMDLEAHPDLADLYWEQLAQQT